MTDPIRAATFGVRVTVHVIPRAARTAVVGRHGDAIKLKVAAPPVDGSANEEIVSFLSRALDLPRSRVSIVAGATSRRKVVELRGVTLERVSALLAPA